MAGHRQQLGLSSWERWQVIDDSKLFLTPAISSLRKFVACHDVVFDQCRFGLVLPPFLPGHFCKKRTKVLISMPQMTVLSRWCPGTSGTLVHDYAWGHCMMGNNNPNSHPQILQIHLIWWHTKICHQDLYQLYRNHRFGP